MAVTGSGQTAHASEQEAPLLAPNSSLFTFDGTVDCRSRPALRTRTGCWLACIFIIGYELIEILSYYGISANLVLYIKNELHEGTAAATKSVNNWTGAATVLPIVGAFIADAYLGRFLTISYSSLFHILGLIMLTLSASLTTLRPASCTSSSSCPKATTAQLAFFYTSLYMIAIGTAGIKPCLVAFGADQFDEEHPVERKSKSSFFNWWYFGVTTGALLAFTVIVYIEDNASSGLGYGILAILIILACAVFLLGTPFYRYKPPNGSSLAGLCRVLVAAARKWRVRVPHDHSLLYEVPDEESIQLGRKQLLHTPGFRFLDKAATLWPSESCGEQALIVSDISTSHPDFKNGVVNPWKLCTVTQVEEVKLFVRIIPIWLTTIVYGVGITEAGTFFVEQAATMDRSVGSLFTIPSASLITFASIAILVILPIYERVLVPVMRRLTGHECGISLLQRLGTGMVLAIISTVVSALVERRRLQVAEDYGLLDTPTAAIPMSVFWLVPQFFIFGMSDVFALVGEQEFFYDQVPDSMRSLGMSLFLCANGLSNYLSSAIISIVGYITTRGGNDGWIVDNLNRCHLDYFYWLLAILFTLNFGVFLALSWSYTYKVSVRTQRWHE